MKGRDWIKYLTGTEENNFLRNLREFRGDYGAEYFLDEEYDDFYHFIAGSFNWGGTPEGGDYWRMISQRNPVVPNNRYRMDKFRFV